MSKSVLGIKNLRQVLVSALGAFGGIYAVFEGLKKSIDISSDLTEVQNVVDVAFGKYKKSIEDFSKISIKDFGMSELTAKTMAGRFQAMGTAIGFSQKKMSGMSVELTKLAADMASFYNVEQEDVAESLQSIFTGQTKPLRAYGLDLTQVTIEEWAHKQGIDAKMKSMSQAEKTMLRYQYVMANTGAAQGDFARTANTWANQVRVLKQNFEVLGSTVGGVLINALKPFVQGLNVIMVQINDFAKIISNALGKIFGWTYEEGGGATNPAEEMSSGMDDVADSTDKATKAQKEYNRQLGKFDELNNYNKQKNNDTNGGDGTGNGITTPSSVGTSGKWTQGKSILKEYESEIDSLYELGAKIGDTLKKAMERIDWDGIYAKAGNFGTGLASFLNGLISPDLFNELGETVAGTLNTALHFLDSFGKTFEWKNFGKSLSEGLKGFFGTFDWELATDTFNTLTNGILDSIIAGLENIGKDDWKKVAQTIADMISGIDVNGITFKVGKIANELVNAFYLLVSNKDTWKNLGTKIADGINGFFEGMNEVDKKTGLTGFQSLGKSISKTISGLFKTLSTAMEKTDWEMIGKSIVDFFANLDFVDILSNAVSLIASIAKGIYELLKGALKEDVTYLKEYLPEWIKSIGTFSFELGVKIGEKAADFASKVKDFILDLPENYIKIAIKIGTTLIELKDKITDFLIGLPIKYYEFGLKIGSTLKDIGSKIGSFLSELPSKAFNFLLKIGSKKKDIGILIGEFLEKLPEKAFKFGLKIGSTLKDVGKKIGEFITDLPQKAYGVGMSVGTKVADFKSKIESFIAQVKKKSKLALAISATFNDAFTKPLKAAWNAIAKTINGAIKTINKLPGINISAKLPTLAKGGIFFGEKIKNITKYASGGFPNMGQMFIAREKGPELVGNLGGHTAVMNNDQIVSSVSDGVYRAVLAAMSNFSYNNRTSQGDIVVQIDGKEVFRAVRNEDGDFKRRTGRRRLLHGIFKHYQKRRPKNSDSNLQPVDGSAQEHAYVTFSAATNVGNVRETNQDNLYVMQPVLTYESLYHYTYSGSHKLPALFAICDGMGGGKNGEKASYEAVRLIEQAPVDALEQRSDAELETFFQELYQKMNDTVYQLYGTTGALVGCTATMLYIDSRRIYMLNAGDSPGMWLTPSGLNVLTQSDNRANQLYQLGQISEAERWTHKTKNQLTQYVGMNPEEVRISPHICRLDRIGSTTRFLICSDGLLDKNTFGEIEEQLRENDIRTAAQSCVMQAMNAGSRDNVSAIVIQVEAC